MITYIGLTTSTIVLIASIRAHQLHSMRTPRNQVHKKIISLLLVATYIMAITYPAIFAYIGSKQGRKGVGITVIISLSLAIIILHASYFLIIREIFKSKNRLSSLVISERAHKRQIKAMTMINLIMLTFVGTNILLLVRGVLMIYSSFNNLWEEENERMLNIFGTVVLITLITLIINPAVYFYAQKDIRREFYKMKLGRMVSKKQVSGEPNTQHKNTRTKHTKHNVVTKQCKRKHLYVFLKSQGSE